MSSSSATAPPPTRVSLNFSNRPAPKAQIPAKRSRAAFGDDEDEEEDVRAERGPQAVTGFEDGGAVVNGSEKKRVKTEPLVIPVQRDVEWGKRPGAGRSKGKNLLPAEVQAQQRAEREGRNGGSAEEKEKHQGALEQAQYGLVLKQKMQTASNDAQMADGEAATRAPTEVPAQPPRTADEEALDRLLHGDERTSTLVIPGASDHDIDPRMPTDFRTDIASRPDAPSVADYEAIPIEDFGAAMLRGMGYDGSGVGRNRKIAQPKQSERRANLLGIGAKQVPEGLEELGAWGGGAKGGKVGQGGRGGRMGPKTRDAYNPLVMRNAKTGEVRTEEELKASKERDERERVDEKERTDREDRDRVRSRRDDSRGRSSRNEPLRLNDRERRPREDRERYDESRERRERDDAPERSRRNHDSGSLRHRSRSRRRSPRPSHRDRADRDRRRDNDYDNRRDREHTKHRSSRH